MSFRIAVDFVEAEGRVFCEEDLGARRLFSSNTAPWDVEGAEDEPTL